MHIYQFLVSAPVQQEGFCERLVDRFLHLFLNIRKVQVVVGRTGEQGLTSEAGDDTRYVFRGIPSIVGLGKI